MTVIAKQISPAEPSTLGFEPDIEQPLFKRLAEFLAWAANKHPGVVYPWNIATKAVMGYKRAPSIKFKEVAHLRSTSSRARVYLMEKYKRDIVTLVGAGVRASTDSDDVYATGLSKRAGNLTRAALAVEHTAALIDPKELNPANRAGMSIILGVCKGLPSLRERLLLSAGKKITPEVTK